jgi:hypothetical protein
LPSGQINLEPRRIELWVCDGIGLELAHVYPLNVSNFVGGEVKSEILACNFSAVNLNALMLDQVIGDLCIILNHTGWLQVELEAKLLK